MTIKTTLVILILTTYTSVFSQSVEFPKGTYMTVQELIARKPSNPYSSYKITQREQKDIFMNGGNDYKIEPLNDSISLKIIKKKAFAISVDNILYINGRPLDLWNWYCTSKLVGNLIFFKAGPCVKQSSPLATNAQPIGGAIGSGMAALKRFLYCIDLKNGQVDIVSENNIDSLLKQKDDNLLNQFKKETSKDETTLIKYYKLAKGL
jgi:hypothetical protein